jgi:homoserine kinase
VTSGPAAGTLLTTSPLPESPGPEHIVVRVPATSANLGPGFDALGLALGLWDTYTVTRRAPSTTAPRASGPCSVRVEGEGADTVAHTEANLVVTAMRAAATDAGVGLPAFDLHCDNGIPHGRGLGSSAAAIVGGVLAGRTLAGLDRDAAAELAVAAALEGHPDNVAAALLGGLTVAWCAEATGGCSSDGGPRIARAVCLQPVPLQVRVFVPPAAMSTRTARGLLPATVPHADAAHAAGRSALLVAALTAASIADRAGALFAGTDDRLHQQVRGAVLPLSWDLLRTLRAAGVAAVLSGSGPTVLALRPQPAALTQSAVLTGPEPAGPAPAWAAADVPASWSVLDLDVVPGARVEVT